MHRYIGMWLLMSFMSYKVDEWHDLDLGDDEDGDGDERSRFGGGDANVAENGSPSRQKGKLFSRQKQIHVQSERRVGWWQHCLSSIERLCRHFALV